MAARYYTLAIRQDGTLWAWGLNEGGQFGDGTKVNQRVPVQVGTATWTSVAAGVGHTVALRTDGTLWAWGSNYDGQLGDGTNTAHMTSMQVGTDTNWASVAAGGFHTVAVRTDGTLWAWGQNENGQLGDGTKVNRHVPVQWARTRTGRAWRRAVLIP
ncbi:hypothetical protein LRS06_21440 [Hymenobacter sp. J193]|uniref:RCC1 domain-containing protein n=1 Tax=Hymenobacter sp. J193 TaxID=2898429 RepID=UPI00215166F9|nr:hypothetical protein [Hymenobacter sp. J193]MCR5890293.1 hypothetical protein [Hymenobacter sp. J193]